MVAQIRFYTVVICIGMKKTIGNVRWIDIVLYLKPKSENAFDKIAYQYLHGVIIICIFYEILYSNIFHFFMLVLPLFRTHPSDVSGENI